MAFKWETVLSVFWLLFFRPFSGPATLLKINSLDFVLHFLWDLGLNQPSGAVLFLWQHTQGLWWVLKRPRNACGWIVKCRIVTVLVNHLSWGLCNEKPHVKDKQKKASPHFCCSWLHLAQAQRLQMFQFQSLAAVLHTFTWKWFILFELKGCQAFNQERYHWLFVIELIRFYTCFAGYVRGSLDQHGRKGGNLSRSTLIWERRRRREDFQLIGCIIKMKLVIHWTLDHNTLPW